MTNRTSKVKKKKNYFRERAEGKGEQVEAGKGTGRRRETQADTVPSLEPFCRAGSHDPKITT